MQEKSKHFPRLCSVSHVRKWKQRSHHIAPLRIFSFRYHKFLQLEHILVSSVMRQSACDGESIKKALTPSSVSPLLRNFQRSASLKQTKHHKKREIAPRGENKQACIIDDKTCMLAKHSGCIPLHVPLLPTPSSPHFISWPLMGGSLHRRGRRR